MHPGHRLPLRCQIAVAIQHVHMRIGIQEAQVVRLSVDFDLLLHHGPQPLAGYHLAVKPTDAAAGVAHHAFQNMGGTGRVHGGGDAGLGLAGPDQRSGCLPDTQQQIEGVQNDGLSGPGFPGQDVEARGKLQHQVIDDGQVADVQGAKHCAVAERWTRFGGYRRGDAGGGRTVKGPDQRGVYRNSRRWRRTVRALPGGLLCSARTKPL